MSYRNTPGTNPTDTSKNARFSNSKKNPCGAAQRKNEDEHQKQPSRDWRSAVSDPQEARYSHSGQKHEDKPEPNMKPKAWPNKSDSWRKTCFEGESNSKKNPCGAAERRNEDEHQKQPSRDWRSAVSDPQEARYSHSGQKHEDKPEPNMKPKAWPNKSDSWRKTCFEGESNSKKNPCGAAQRKNEDEHQKQPSRDWRRAASDSQEARYPMKYQKELAQLDKNTEKLPLSDKCIKMISQGIDQGCAYEAVVLAAYFSVESFLFKYVKEDKEYQKATDVIKFQMIKLDSDPLTFLYAFKSWVESGFSKSWCEERHIDRDMLNEVKRNIGDIFKQRSELSNKNILQQFSKTEKRALKEMLFDCFGDHLCFFSGHFKTGYIIASKGHTAFIHPSSMVYRKENLPRCIIYNKVVPGSRDFLLGITAVPEEMVNYAYDEKKLVFDDSRVFGKILVPKVIEPVSEKVIKQTLLGKQGNKLHEIEKGIKEILKIESLVIDPSVENGSVSVYAVKSALDSAVNEVEKILKSCLDNSIDAEKIYTLELKKGEVTVGLEVKCIKGATITSVKLLSSHDAPSMSNNASCISRESSKNASPAFQHSVNLTGIRRRFICYVDLTESSFNQVIRNCTRKFRLLDSNIYFKPSTKGNNQLFVPEVSTKANEVDIENALKLYFPDVKILKITKIPQPPSEITEKDIKGIEGEIKKICKENTNLVNFEVKVPKPKNGDVEMKAYINVSDTKDLKSAAEKLSNKLVNGFELNAIPVYRFVIRSSLSVYNALKSRIEKEIQELQSQLRIKFPDKDPKKLFKFETDKMEHKDSVRLKFLSNDITIMGMLQRTVNELLEGKILNKINNIHKLFCHGGHMWLKKLEKEKGVYILEDYNSKIIRIYGRQESCSKVEDRICRFLENTENEAVERIDLSRYRSNRMLLKAIINKFGASLESFVRDCELLSAVLDIKFSSITLHGDRKSIEKAKEELDKLSNTFATYSSPLSSGDECPVCACPAFDCASRLEHCGHLYCNECLKGLVEEAGAQLKFPIQCCGKGCSKDIVLDDIVRILGDDEKLKKLLHSSLKDFLERKRSEIIFCPAPDCAMFFYKNQVNGKVNCPLCENDICSRCNVIYHHGFTCDFYQQTRTDPNYSFKVWQSGVTNCKQCPRCNTAIERTAGCDHMTCANCKVHFCWLCLREFPASEAYLHTLSCDRNPLRIDVINRRLITLPFFQEARRDPTHSFNERTSSGGIYKKCPRCAVIIERSSGGDAMTCIMCNAHFCWICVREFPASEIELHTFFCGRRPLR